MSERDPIDRDVEREEAAAAEEAGRIGGRSGMEDVPEEERPLAESGEGESEGFEQAEDLLEERATHADDRGGPLQDRPDPEEPGGERAVYADADSVESTETDVDTQGTSGDLDGSGEGGVPDTQT
ncbi:MAG TPA: hypothetical protein VFT14_00740 [Solirubrobacterales bacterium]|nr:hypothetical protein [Solirubrobacterales bacterium]